MIDDIDLGGGGSHRGAKKGLGSGSSWKIEPQTFMVTGSKSNGRAII